MKKKTLLMSISSMDTERLERKPEFITLQELAPWLTGFARIIEYEAGQSHNRVLALNEGCFKRGFFHGYGRSLSTVTLSCKIGFWNA